MARVKKLSTAEVFYVQQHRDKFPADQIAKHLGVKENAVVKWLNENPLPEKRAGFDPSGISEDRQTVVMTQAQSAKDDKIRPSADGNSYEKKESARQEEQTANEWFQKNKKDLHVIRPGEPVF